YSRVREPAKALSPRPARPEGTNPMPSSAAPRAISLADSSCTKSLGSMSATWGKAFTACPWLTWVVSASAPSFCRPWSTMMAPVASRTGTCQSLVAIKPPLHEREKLCEQRTPSRGARARPAAPKDALCWVGSACYRSPNERSTRLVVLSVGAKTQVRSWEERNEAPTPHRHVDRLPAAGRGRLWRRRKRRQRRRGRQSPPPLGGRGQRRSGQGPPGHRRRLPAEERRPGEAGHDRRGPAGHPDPVGQRRRHPARRDGLAVARLRPQ